MGVIQINNQEALRGTVVKEPVFSFTDKDGNTELFLDFLVVSPQQGHEYALLSVPRWMYEKHGYLFKPGRPIYILGVKEKSGLIKVQDAWIAADKYAVA